MIIIRKTFCFLGCECRHFPSRDLELPDRSVIDLFVELGRALELFAITGMCLVLVFGVLDGLVVVAPL